MIDVETDFYRPYAEAVQTAMNSMMPQIETMVRSAIRTEIASIFLGQVGFLRQFCLKNLDPSRRPNKCLMVTVK